MSDKQHAQQITVPESSQFFDQWTRRQFVVGVKQHFIVKRMFIYALKNSLFKVIPRLFFKHRYDF